MKFASSFVLLGAVTATTNITLKEAYGELQEVKSMLPYYSRRRGRAAIPESFLSVRTADNCIFPIDLLILQDATSSFQDDYANMANVQLGLMESALNAEHPGSRVGVVTFRDKPIWSLGEPNTDYCQRFDLPLTNDFSAVNALYEKLQSVGGGDPPENQFGALVAAAQSTTPGWGGNPDAAALVVVVTDAAPHFSADGFNVYGLTTFSGHFAEEDADNQCKTEYYPSAGQVSESLLSRELYLGALVYDSQYDQFQPRDSWKWFINYLGELPEFYHDINEDSSNFWEVLSSVIKTLEDVECGETSTTPTPTPEATASVVGSTQEENTLPPSCGVCPNPCPPEGCDPCCADGVLIKLRHRPARLHLEIENPSADLE